jgi:hypothetical protein
MPWWTEEESTCAKLGKEATQCMYCGDKQTRDIPKLPHTFGEWAVIRDATCSQVGEMARECTACHESETSEIPLGKHEYGEWYYTDAPESCTDAGVQRADCLNCDKFKTRKTSPGKHTEVIDPAIEPTCTADGLTEGSHCGVCGKTVVAQKVVASNGHTHGEWVTVIEPEVGKDGLETLSCTVCGEKLGENVLPAIKEDQPPVEPPVDSGDPPAVEPEYVLGDADGNGTVDKFDYIRVKRFVLGTIELNEDQRLASDVNLDGTVDKYDYILIKRHCLGTYVISH